jgi:protoporphyrinogen IX oxidase
MLLLFKSLHVASVALWFAGLFLLPTLLASRARCSPEAEDEGFVPLARRLYFHLMTPAAALAVLIGGGLVPYAQDGAWLAAKLLLVAASLALHVYLGLALFDLSNGRSRHGSGLFRGLGLLAFVFATGILAVTAVKPLTLAPFDPATEVPATPVPREPGLPEADDPTHE